MSPSDTHDAYLRYRTGLTISCAVVFIQMIALGFMAYGDTADWSIGLFEDAVHGIADNLVLVGATIILYFEVNGATPNKGRKRILALFGGVLLVFAGVWGGWTAYGRISGAQLPVSAWVLAVTSLIAVIGGGFAFRVIHGVHESGHDHMHESAIGHLIGDLAISVAVFLSSVGIILWGIPAIDSWMALVLISPWMLFRGIQILKYRDPPESNDIFTHVHADDKNNHHH